MVDQFLEDFARFMCGYSDLIEITAVTKAANQIHQRQTAFERHAAMRLRATDEILNQQRFAINLRRQEQTLAVALPAFGQSSRSSHRPNLAEYFFPICFRITALKIISRRVQQPTLVA